MADTSPTLPPVDIVDLKSALSQRYLTYALSTITSRSLPDVRDGLKPVQRRILYAMLQLRLDPASGHKKCARVVGDVIGKFHPHGEGAVYDALVRLAQNFAQRYPLVDGQGNFGNIDGDNAAAMRYTESRLTEVARSLLDGIDLDTVDFRPNYDSSEHEPVVLPAAFPNLLANGTTGIAVGMATSIPPHNAGEICAALIHLLARPDATTADLVEHVQGPDFPTGGILVEPREQILGAYETGRGGFRVRACWQVEKLTHGQYQVIVTEVPYHVQKSRLIERIADLLANRKLSLLQDLRDESTEDVRIVLVPRSRLVEPELLMEQLFRQCDFEVRISLNMNVLDATGVPRVMSLGEVLGAFLEHRMVVLIRRSRFRLGKIEDRLEILDGYLKAFVDLDEVIRIIREEDDPKTALMARFELIERQAEAILNLRLRHLRRLEEMQLTKERRGLRAERKDLKALLGDEGLRRNKLSEEIAVLREQFGDGLLGARRTIFGEVPEIDAEAVEAPVERQPVTVICSKNGWIRTLRGHLDSDAEIKFKEGDDARFALHAQSTDKVLLISTDGRCYLLPIDRLPGGRGQGEPIRLHIDLAKDADLFALCIHRSDGRLVLASLSGRGFVAEEKSVAAQTRGGKQVLNLGRGDQLVALAAVEGDHVAVVGSNRKMLVFPLNELPVMSRGKGVILQRFREGKLADLMTLNLADGLTWPMGERQRHEKDLTPWLGRRAGAGRMAPMGFPKNNRFR